MDCFRLGQTFSLDTRKLSETGYVTKFPFHFREIASAIKKLLDCVHEVTDYIPSAAGRQVSTYPLVLRERWGVLLLNVPRHYRKMRLE